MCTILVCVDAWTHAAPAFGLGVCVCECPCTCKAGRANFTRTDGGDLGSKLALGKRGNGSQAVPMVGQGQCWVATFRLPQGWGLGVPGPVQEGSGGVLVGTSMPDPAKSSGLGQRTGVGTQVMEVQGTGPGPPSLWIFPFLLGPLLTQLLGEMSDSVCFKNPATFPV